MNPNFTITLFEHITQHDVLRRKTHDFFLNEQKKS